MSVYVTPVQLPVGPPMLPLLPPALVLTIVLLFTAGIMSLAHTHAHACLLLPISASLSRFRPLLLATAAPPSIHCPCNSRRCPDAPLPYPQYVSPLAQPRPVSNSWLRLSVGPHSTRLCTHRASLIFRLPSPALGFWILRLRCRLRLVSCGLSYARW